MKTEMRRGIIDKMGYSYNDLTIVPCVVSDIDTRKKCQVYDKNGMLPIFVAPMMSVVNAHNYHIWYANCMYAIMPRTVPYAERIANLKKGGWTALSRKEFVKYFVNMIDKISDTKAYYVCVDLANGHMKGLYDDIRKAKDLAHERGYKLTVMTGNVANPETYKWICDRSVEWMGAEPLVDYIRLSIGSGAGCLTASNTGVHYPIATLIDECKKIKEQYEDFNIDGTCPKIVADGGIRNYDDINKAYALGADYVMIGSLLSGLLESSADVVIESNDPVKYPVYYDRETGEVEYYINYDESKMVNIWDNNHEEQKQELIRSMKSITKRFFGMSTKEAQMAINAALEQPIIVDKKDLKTSEGCTKFITCKYTIAQWKENMVDYLKSAMSYCDAHTIKEFCDYTYLIPNSPGEMMAVNK